MRVDRKVNDLFYNFGVLRGHYVNLQDEIAALRGNITGRWWDIRENDGEGGQPQLWSDDALESLLLSMKWEQVAHWGWKWWWRKGTGARGVLVQDEIGGGGGDDGGGGEPQEGSNPWGRGFGDPWGEGREDAHLDWG